MIDNVSEKWKKCAILVQYELTTEDILLDQIKRYHRSEINSLASTVSAQLKDECCPPVFTIKLVPHTLRPKLKNYIIHNQNELLSAICEIEHINSYDELWCCKSPSSLNSCVFGRLYINSGGNTTVTQYIDQVWADSARKLERIGENYPFISANRVSWGRSYQITGCNFIHIDENIAVRQFHYIIEELESKRERIEQFVSAAARLNLYSMCLEYKLTGEKLSIIDWDTPDDRAILRAYI